MQFATLGMASPFISSRMGAPDSHGFMAQMAVVRQQAWHGLHMSLGQLLLVGPSCALIIIRLAA